MKQLTDIEIKARVYDCSVSVNNFNAEIKVLNDELIARQNAPKAKAPIEEIPAEDIAITQKITS